MNIYLGNISFDQVESKLGYKLSDDDRSIWNEFHNDNADLHGKESCFHVFDIPRCIIFRGESAKGAIIKMFTPNKITNSIGKFHVYEQGKTT